MTGAHPRSRGENDCADRQGRAQAGSSPLTRGKQLNELPCRLDPGLIPAHAGKTHGFRAASGGPWAHPRSRGENLATTDLTEFQMGSSPLTRGKHAVEEGHALGGGLIPAHAGKTRDGLRDIAGDRAHPRSRGENPAASHAGRQMWGSSPLTRGKLVRGGAGLPACGLIPAHAGKTSSPTSATD